MASEGMDDSDRTTMEGLADVIAGRTYGEADRKAHIEAPRAAIKRRQNA